MHFYPSLPMSSPLFLADTLCCCCRQYASAVYDWLDTNALGLHVNIRVNDTNAAQSGTGAPVVQRWNAAVNMASNAFLNYSQVRTNVRGCMYQLSLRDVSKLVFHICLIAYVLL